MKSLSPLIINSFDISHYPGLTAQDVIPELIKKLKITFAKLNKDSIEYQAIKTYIRLLNTYLTIANTTSFETTEILSFFNALSEHLQNYIKEKYPKYDIYIKPERRIKSPISANKKIKQKIASYMREHKNLENVNIADFLAFRFIIEARDACGNLITADKSVEICYLCVYEAIEYIKNQISIQLMRVSKIPQTQNTPPDIYVPSVRPEYIERYSDFIKDFIFLPKAESNYQSDHLQFCLTPDIQTSTSNPTRNTIISGELQFRTYLMNEYAERGHASHKKYKTREQISYLAIPQILVPTTPFSSKVTFLKPDDAFEKHLGFSPKQIHHLMSFDYLKYFLESTGYAHPVLPLYFKINENNEILFIDDLKTHSLPLEIISLEDQNEMRVLIGDIFDEKTFDYDLHEFI